MYGLQQKHLGSYL